MQHGGRVDMNDGRGVQEYSGVAILMKLLAKEFAPLEVETTIKTIADLMSFRRHASESIDSALSRFSVLRSRARNLGGFVFGTTGAA
eukprot:15851539-Heterocapsa_arctica.AAC.1